MLGISRLLVIVLLKKKPEKSNTFPILQIKKLRVREIMELLGRCTVCQGPGWIWNPNLNNSKALAISSPSSLGKLAEARSWRALSTKESYQPNEVGKLDPMNDGKPWKTFK